ncbi:MAG: isoprenylcysteine carboxylmethyltransferase family protein [Actinomycetota bacterium]
MSAGIVVFTVYAVVLRGLSLAISFRNERRIKREGAIEYGKGGTAFLTGVSFLYAASAIVEGAVRRVQFGVITVWGIAIHAFSMVMLFYVIYALRDVWTVKILIARQHRLVTSWFFRTIKHPNYFLNLIPEFIGLTLVVRAWLTAATLFPVLLLAIGIRIVQEERAMRQAFAGYRGVLRHPAV